MKNSKKWMIINKIKIYDNILCPVNNQNKFLFLIDSLVIIICFNGLRNVMQLYGK